MEVQYEKPLKDSPLSLFTYNHIYHILSANIGLRLTNHSTEITAGGFGDAIPLSHLGGAKDSILFATLGAILLQDSESNPTIVQQHIQTLTAIFESYAGHDHSRLNYAPKLMRVYAHLLQISAENLDSKLLERRLPKDEESTLITIYTAAGGPVFPILVFERNSAYFGDLPSLRLHLTSDFNQLLEQRLLKNLGYYSAQSMHYLLLTDTQERYHSGYDFSHDPLGKAGKATFSPQDIISDLTVTDHTVAPIQTWLKQQIMVLASAMDATPLTKSPTYVQQSIQFCQSNRVYMAGLLGAGLFAGYKIMQYQQTLQEDLSTQNTV